MNRLDEWKRTQELSEAFARMAMERHGKEAIWGGARWKDMTPPTPWRVKAAHRIEEYLVTLWRAVKGGQS